MIPKIIHYCWFGRGEFPEKVKYCIESWERILPDYKLMLWNEDNFDYSQNQFAQKAYSEGKFAFVADYARVAILKQYGGIYLDTDVEIVKNLDSFLLNELFLGMEEPMTHSMPATCIIGCIPQHELLCDFYDYYSSILVMSGRNTLDMTPNTVILDRLIKNRYHFVSLDDYLSFRGKIRAYPYDYFHPISGITGVLSASENTCAIHHHTKLWVGRKTKIIKWVRERILVPILGKERYMRFVRKVRQW